MLWSSLKIIVFIIMNGSNNSELNLKFKIFFQFDQNIYT